jgi:hypothetical protein
MKFPRISRQTHELDTVSGHLISHATFQTTQTDSHPEHIFRSPSQSGNIPTNTDMVKNVESAAPIGKYTYDIPSPSHAEG